MSDTSPVRALLTARRFAPLFVTQFLGALNDNLLKSALAILVTYRLSAETGIAAPTLVMIAGALFIAPFFLFSGAAGTLADRLDKSRIARWVKLAEIAIMAIGGAGLFLPNVPLLLVALFLLGTHSTVFGPIKYALLPQHLPERELVAGNALVEAGTFLAILLGTILGSSLVLISGGAVVVAAIGIAAALAGWAAARMIPPAPPTGPESAPAPRLVADSLDVVRHAAKRPDLLLPMLAISWFWLVGATFVSGLPVFAKDVLFAGEHVVTLMLAVFAIGIGAGSLLAERLLHGEVSARHVPIAALAMALFAIDLAWASAGRAPLPELASASAFLAQPANLRVLIDLAGLAVAGGLFTVPLYAMLQQRSEPAHRARVIAANNII
ncbi:MAG: MFS transporter, partial [Alphaproteobacteria bacterium]|nr:MFS transporter [Alphaproteobacteria bacterium]